MEQVESFENYLRDTILPKARTDFRLPEATSYLNGYLRMMELRAETELALGKSFNQLSFHDFILSLGLLPPKLIREAVQEEFIPSFR